VPTRWTTLVGALALTEIVSWGVLYYAFGVLVPAMQAELGWSQALLGGGFSLALVVAALVSIPIGRHIERRGPRGVMSAGSLVASAALFAWSTVAHPLAFLASAVVLGLAMAMVLYEAAFAAVILGLGRGKRTDVALLVLTVVAGLASTVFLPLTQFLAEHEGWRGALWRLALLELVVTLPLHAWVLRGLHGARTDAAAIEPPAGRAPARRALLGSTAGFALAFFAASGVVTYLVPSLQERGFAPEHAALAGGLFGIGQVVGRVLFTLARDRLTLGAWCLPLFVLPALGIGGLAGATSELGVLACILAFAFASGGQTLARSTWILELFPLPAFARVNGILGLGTLLGRAVAPLAVGAVHDLSGSHRPAFLGLASACLAGGACAWWATRGSARS